MRESVGCGKESVLVRESEVRERMGLEREWDGREGLER